MEDKEMINEEIPQTSPETREEEKKDNTDKTVKNGEDIQAACRSLELELKEEKDRFLRLAAQFDNYRKRTEKEKTEIFEEGERFLVQEFLPLLDNLERAEQALDKGEDAGAVKEGVELILEKFRKILQKLEIETVESGMFDPYFHHAVEIREGDEYEDNRIVETVQKGFVHKGKLIRPAIVVVGRHKEMHAKKKEKNGDIENEE